MDSIINEHGGLVVKCKNGHTCLFEPGRVDYNYKDESG